MSTSNHIPNNGRLIIVSNRLPVLITEEEGVFKTISGSGGLITALAPVLKNRGGIWIGNVGSFPEEKRKEIFPLLAKENRKTGFYLHPLFLEEEEAKLYYDGFANAVIWPLFHDLQSECHFNPTYWTAAQNVNEKFANTINQQLKVGDFIWVHDYHLLLVGQELRKREIKQKIAFFLHIPFPCLDIFIKLPWRFQILKALLEYDLVGFQTIRDQRNFISCVKKLLPHMKVSHGRNVATFQKKEGIVQAATFPISIDYKEFSTMAAGKEVTKQVLEHYTHLQQQRVIFSCDRLDISKGIPYRLEAVRRLLKDHPEIHEKVTFFQIVVPSRVEIPKYQELKKEIDRLVGEINSEFAKTGWTPIQYLFRSISRKELLAFYRVSEVALITPIKDGMNLVAKEYIASNINENGVLVLSEFAGCAMEFQNEALLINPYDVEGLAESIYKALNLASKDRKKRMRKMRRRVEHYDVFWWVKAFLIAAISKELRDFPIVEEYIPSETT